MLHTRSVAIQHISQFLEEQSRTPQAPSGDEPAGTIISRHTTKPHISEYQIHAPQYQLTTLVRTLFEIRKAPNNDSQIAR